MLAFLSGTVKERQNGELILLVGTDSQGWVGYQVKIPDHPRYETYIPGQKAEVYLYTHVREDALDLYGFQSAGEKNLYMTLLSVSGVGPKMGLGLLSHADSNTLIEMILSEDKAGLTHFPGVGKKTAERMILELKDVIQKKMDAGLYGRVLAQKNTTSAESTPGTVSVDRSNKVFIEAYLALQGLGYKEIMARQMVEAALKKHSDLHKVEDVIKHALQATI